MKKFFKKFLLSILCAVAAAFGCVALFACSSGGDGGEGGNGDGAGNNQTGGLYGKWDEYDGVRLGFADEVAFNGGYIDESKILPELDCELNGKYYMVMDFDVQAPHDNDGGESVTASLRIQPASAVAATIQETQTGNVNQETKDGVTTIQATYKIPASAEDVRNIRFAVRLIAGESGLLDIRLAFEGSGQMQAVKTEKIEKCATMGYNKDLTYEPADGCYAVTGGRSSSTIIIPNMHDGRYVRSIGAKAFEGFSFTNVIMSDSLTSIDQSAFLKCKLLTGINIPRGVASIGSGAFAYCSALKSITVDADNPYFKSENNCVLSKDGKGLIACCTGSVIPDGVTRIGDYAFYCCEKLTEIAIPDSVTEIGEYAFYNCSGLTSITIPNGLHVISANAFSYCSGLTSIAIPGGVTSIGNSAFNDCSGLTGLTISSGVTGIGEGAFAGCRGLKSVTIPNSVTSIGESAFQGCFALLSVTISRSVTVIGSAAFGSCYALTDITYRGTKAQWAAVVKASGWDVDSYSYTVSCTDGKLDSNGNEI